METIGIIDDDEDSGLYLTALLEDRYHVAFYQHWKDAEEAFSKDPPSLIMLDISMPDMKGGEVLKRIREIPKLADVSVIALTAYALPEDREKFLREGFDGYVAKPITDAQALLNMIGQFLNQK